MRRLTTAEFTEKAKAVWGDRWDYRSTVYRTRNLNISITCRRHGTFIQSPTNHLAKRIGCDACKLSSQPQLKITTEAFIISSQAVWGDRWDYSKSVYQGVVSKLTITCTEHGDFQQTPQGHIYHRVGCKECQLKALRKRRSGKITSKDFIVKSQTVWGDRWDYSILQYLNMKSPVSIICREHGEFTQLAQAHLSFWIGCPQCSTNERYTGKKRIRDYVKGNCEHD